MISAIVGSKTIDCFMVCWIGEDVEIGVGFSCWFVVLVVVVVLVDKREEGLVFSLLVV